MAKTLELAKNLHLPLEAVTETFAILAKRGAGKSYTASVIVEGMLGADLHVVILDPMGIWYGLRTMADGKSPGFQIPILGGEHGDIPLESTSGKFVADLIMADKISAVLDVSLFSKAERKRFVADFAERLYRKNREALHLVLEEADMFAPQRPQQGEQRMLGAIEDLVRRGRSRGIGLSLISQRSAVLNKDVLTQTECLVALRTTAPHDRRAIKDWIDAHADREQQKEVLDSLPSLPTGTAWFWSPSWLEQLQKVRVKKKLTLDTGATPKAGVRNKTQKTVAAVDLAQLTQQMSTTIEKAKAEDPRELQARIRELEKQVAAPAAAANPDDVGPAIARALSDASVDWDRTFEQQRQLIASFENKNMQTGAKLQAVAAELTKIGEGLATNKKPIEKPDAPILPPSTIAPARKVSPATQPPPWAADGTYPEVDNSEQRILDAIGWLNTIGVDEPNQTAVCFLAGYRSVDSGGYKNPRSRLNTKGLVEYRGKQIVLTDAGCAIAQTPSMPLNRERLHEAIMSKLKGPEQKLLDIVIRKYPNSISNEEWASRTGYEQNSGGFKNPRSRLKTLGLVEYTGPGETRANDFLFPSNG